MDTNNLVVDLELSTLNNTLFRRVISTNEHSQLVLMSILPNHDIGMEMHPDNDQFIRIEEGEGYARLGNKYHQIHDGVSITVPAGTYHNIVNTSPDYDLKLYTIYSPPLHEEDEIISNEV